MINIDIPDDFQDRINLFPSLARAYDAKFRKDKHVVGASSLPYGMRKVVIKKAYGIHSKMNMRMLAGKIVEDVFQQEPALSYIVNDINEALGIELQEAGEDLYYPLENGNYGKFEVKVRDIMEKYVHFGDDYHLRLHPDIYTPLYIVEQKFTGGDYRDFQSDEYLKRITHYEIQLNTYLGFFHVPIGFVLVIHDYIFKTRSKSWDYIWKNYCRLISFKFNEKLFKLTIERAKEIFRCIETEDFLTPTCPEFLWECKAKYCDVRDDCPIKISKVRLEEFVSCEHCGERIKPGTLLLERGGRYWHNRGKDDKFKVECNRACMKACERPRPKEMMG